MNFLDMVVKLVIRQYLTLEIIVSGGYNELYEWSIENVSEFWENVWHFTDIKYSTCYSQVRRTAMN